MTQRCNRLLLVPICVAMLAGAAAADDWPNFLGPNYDSKSSEKGLRYAWTEPLPLLWERDIGSAFSGISCVDGRAYTCGTADGKQVLYCLNADTGEVIWQQAFEGEYRESQGGDGTRATPTVHEGRVYIFGALGTFACYDAKDGRELWKHDFNAEPRWGYSGSVLIEGDLAVISPGGAAGALLAVNKNTGERVWSAGKDGAGYATPYPFTLSGKRYLVGFVAQAAMIVEAATGREVWRTPWRTDWDVNAASPIFHDGDLFISSGYRTGSALFKLEPDGDKLKGTKVWENDVLMSKFQTPVLVDGFLYASDQNGLRCVNWKTGEAAWRERRLKAGGASATNGTMVYADGHLFLLTESGELVIAKASPEGFEPITHAKILSGRCWTVPTLYNGRIYARNLTRLAAFDLRAQQ